MPRKKAVKKAAKDFCHSIDKIVDFTHEADRQSLGDESISWIYDHAIIKLYREFESLMLDALIGVINNDTQTLSKVTGHSFPKHLTQDVCRFLVTGTGYFDFRGRDGLIRTLKNFVPDDHYIVLTIKQKKYKSTLEQLVALRNFATHNSEQSKNAALKAIGQQRMSSSGAWLKKQSRLEDLADSLKMLAMEIHDHAPF